MFKGHSTNFPFMNSLKIPKCATNQDSLLLKTLQIESEQIINFILMPDVCYILFFFVLSFLVGPTCLIEWRIFGLLQTLFYLFFYRPAPHVWLKKTLSRQVSRIIIRALSKGVLKSLFSVLNLGHCPIEHVTYCKLRRK